MNISSTHYLSYRPILCLNASMREAKLLHIPSVGGYLSFLSSSLVSLSFITNRFPFSIFSSIQLSVNYNVTSLSSLLQRCELNLSISSYGRLWNSAITLVAALCASFMVFFYYYYYLVTKLPQHILILGISLWWLFSSSLLLDRQRQLLYFLVDCEFYL